MYTFTWIRRRKLYFNRNDRTKVHVWSEGLKKKCWFVHSNTVTVAPFHYRALSISGKPVKEPTTESSGNDVCKVQNFDAVFYQSSTSNTYFLKGKYVWEINSKRIITKTELISSKWPGLESDIDSAYVRISDGDIIFFKGNRYVSRPFMHVRGKHA